MPTALFPGVGTGTGTHTWWLYLSVLGHTDVYMEAQVPNTGISLSTPRMCVRVRVRSAKST